MRLTIDIIACKEGNGVQLYCDGILYVEQKYQSSRQFMEHLCLANGTTLEGCYEASRILLDNAYKRPIYIGGNCNQIYIPTSSIKNRHCTWISLDYLLKESLHSFNLHGFEIMSIKSWQKHLSDGIALRQAIFNEKTVMRT